MPAFGVARDAMEIVFPEELTIRTIGPMPSTSLPSMVTLIVAVQASPAFGAAGAPIMLRFRSFASAAGAAARPASTTRAAILRILPPSFSVLHHRASSGSAVGGG